MTTGDASQTLKKDACTHTSVQNTKREMKTLTSY